MAAPDCSCCGRVIDTDGDWIQVAIRKMIGGTGFHRYSQSIRTDNYHTTCWDKREELV